MNADGLANLADFTLLLSIALLFVAVVTAVVDAFMEEIDIRARLDRSKEVVIAEGARMRDQMFMVRHIPSFIAGGTMLMFLSLALPRIV